MNQNTTMFWKQKIFLLLLKLFFPPETESIPSRRIHYFLTKSCQKLNKLFSKEFFCWMIKFHFNHIIHKIRIIWLWIYNLKLWALYLCCCLSNRKYCAQKTKVWMSSLRWDIFQFSRMIYSENFQTFQVCWKYRSFVLLLSKYLLKVM